jgi:hypothetical protein
MPPIKVCEKNILFVAGWQQKRNPRPASAFVRGTNIKKKIRVVLVNLFLASEMCVSIKNTIEC